MNKGERNMANAKKETAVATVEEKTTALSFVAEEVDESQYVANFSFKSDEQAIAFLKQAQAMSPELNAARPEYIDGLKQGGFFISGVNKVFNEGCFIIPCYMLHEHIFWKANQGGFDSKAPYSEEIQQQLIRDESKNFLPDGRQVENALTYFVLVVDPENPNQLPTPAMLKCASTKFTAAKKFNTILNSAQLNAAIELGFRPPIYRFLASVSSVAQTNTQNQTFFNLDFKLTTAHPYLNKKGMIAVKAILDLAKQLSDMAAANQINVDYSADAAAGETTSNTTDLI